MPETTEDSQPVRQPLPTRLRSLYQRTRLTPRLSLFFIAIVVKLLASALSGIGFVIHSPVLLIGGSVVWLVFFVLLFAIAIPATDNRLKRHMRWLKPAAATIFSVLLIVGIIEFAIACSIGFGGVGFDILGDNTQAVMEAFDNTFRYNDATALCHQAIDNFLDNQNPYAQANISKALIDYEIPLDKLTPLREGRFADVFPYPSNEQLAIVAQEAMDYPSQIPVELESKLGYPAGCFLIPAPFVMTGMGDLRLVYLIIILFVLAYAMWKVPRGKRLIVTAAMVVSLEFWNCLAAGETGFLCFPFLLLAWILPPKRRLLAAGCMGLAVIIKQVAWFFLPFYLILIFRREGLRKSLESLGIIAAVFIVFNLPYILGDPGLWLASIMSPIMDNLFPLGVGIVTLVTGGLIETQSSTAFTVMEWLAFGAAIIWYFRYCLRYPNTGPILSVLPLFFAWRSLWPYFFYIDFIVLLAVVINEYGRRKELPPVIPEKSQA
jgi:hypothetical protein